MSIAQHGASLEYCVSEKQSTDQVDKSSVVFVDQRTSTPKIDTSKKLCTSRYKLRYFK